MGTALTRWGCTLTAAAIALVTIAVRVTAVPAHAQMAQKLTPEAILDHQMKLADGGSPDAGRPIFDEVCAACHRFGAIGNDLGPDLTTITSRFKKQDILEAILWPSRVISDQYKAEMFQLKGGAIISGVIVRETPQNVLVRTAEAPERPVQVPKAQIVERAESAVSLMPEGLLEGYSQSDIADLLAFVLAPPPAK